MATSKRPSQATDIYNKHLAGGKFAPSDNVQREFIIERMYVRILSELCANRFKWTGMPATVDLRFMELTLYWTGLSVFYLDKRYGQFFALRGGGTNWNNMMDNPVGFNVVGAGSQFIGMNVSAVRETEKAGIAVPIWANYMRIPDTDIVSIYARKFANLDRTIEINSDNARRSKMVFVSENQKLSAVNVIRQIEEGQPAVYLNDAQMQTFADAIQAVDLGVNPDTIEKLHIVRTRLWNECMTLLGIDNANQDKKERLVASEVSANDDQTSMMRYVNLNARKQAAENINKVYGLKVDVEYNKDVDKAAQDMISGMGGE